MSATASPDPAAAPGADEQAPREGLGYPGLWADLACAALVAVFLGLMVALPDYQAIPYHLLYLTLILVYGWRVWPVLPTVAVFAFVFFATGTLEVLAFRRHEGDVGELFEVLLMPAILAAMMWSVRRREAAERRAQALAARESDIRQAETQFLRESAHALRNPVAVARGWLDLADERPATAPPDVADRVRTELGRIDRIAAELLDIAAHPDTPPGRLEAVDLVGIATEAFARWRTTADRTWRLHVDARVLVLADRERLVNALDAIVENALRFTRKGDTVGLVARGRYRDAVLAVTDSGPGIAEADREKVFDRFWRGMAPDGSRGTGLGLAFVSVVASQYGGRAFAASSVDGGAFVGMTLPQHVPAVDGAEGADGETIGSDEFELDLRDAAQRPAATAPAPRPLPRSAPLPAAGSAVGSAAGPVSGRVPSAS